MATKTLGYICTIDRAPAHCFGGQLFATGFRSSPASLFPSRREAERAIRQTTKRRGATLTHYGIVRVAAPE